MTRKKNDSSFVRKGSVGNGGKTVEQKEVGLGFCCCLVKNCAFFVLCLCCMRVEVCDGNKKNEALYDMLKGQSSFVVSFC